MTRTDGTEKSEPIEKYRVPEKTTPAPLPDAFESLKPTTPSPLPLVQPYLNENEIVETLLQLCSMKSEGKLTEQMFRKLIDALLGQAESSIPLTTMIIDQVDAFEESEKRPLSDPAIEFENLDTLYTSLKKQMDENKLVDGEQFLKTSQTASILVNKPEMVEFKGKLEEMQSNMKTFRIFPKCETTKTEEVAISQFRPTPATPLAILKELFKIASAKLNLRSKPAEPATLFRDVAEEKISLSEFDASIEANFEQVDDSQARQMEEIADDWKEKLDTNQILGKKRRFRLKRALSSFYDSFKNHLSRSKKTTPAPTPFETNQILDEEDYFKDTP